MSDTKSRVVAIIVDKLGVDEAEVTAEASFTNDLGADSLDKVEMLMEQTVEYLKSQGVEIVELDQLFDPAAHAASFEVMLYEYKDGLNKYFASTCLQKSTVRPSKESTTTLS